MKKRKITCRDDCKEKKGILSKILSFFGVLLLIGIISYEVMVIVDKATGYNMNFINYRTSVIVSDSMSFIDPTNEDRLKDYEERIYKGDLVVSTNKFNYEDIKINDVVVYFNGKTLVCHRVIDKVNKNNVNYLITQGDANNINDGLIPLTDVKGKVINVIHYLGYINLYLTSPYGIFAVISVIFIIIVFLLINEILKSKENKNNENNNKEVINLDSIKEVKENNKK